MTDWMDVATLVANFILVCLSLFEFLSRRYEINFSVKKK